MSDRITTEAPKILEDFTKLPDFNKLKGHGGSFLVVPLDQYKVFSKEQFTDDQKMFANAALEYAVNRMKPVKEELKNLNKELTLEIIKELGEMGFLGVDIPEEYGGSDLDKTTAAIVVDYLAFSECSSMMVTLGAHSGIGTLPLIWYGTEEQKKKYLPKITSGESLACYALTEPNAGSDAMNGESTACLNDEKTHYILNGQKIYITNGSWADICVTFAKVDGKMTSFILDKSCKGWEIGAEEKKMGIKGSSTTTIYFENCKVPVENLLGKVGEGGHIALNVLYAGRWKLGFSSAAGCKTGIQIAYNFAKERNQFSRSIATFGMIQNKFSKMVVKAWESDTLNYATTGSIDCMIATLDKSDSRYYEKMQKIIEDHAIEASICKVLGSEALAFCADEGVQIFGGAGFIEEYPVAGFYRDERINRIFEGTNEINRLIIGGTLLKKAILEELPIRDQIYHRTEDFLPLLTFSDDHELSSEISVIELSRSLMLDTLHRLILKYGQDLKNEQWALEPLADIVISLSVMQMGFSRYNQLPEGEHKSKVNQVVRYSIYNNFNILKDRVSILISYICDDLELKESMMRFNKRVNELEYNPDSIALKKSICEELYKNGKYYLD